ncbi:MAG TPA: hypothetical protein EYH28_05530 [Anaerolineaceae bacterium]|nr:hypothetical protein [Anaerolineaceae bacterium]
MSTPRVMISADHGLAVVYFLQSGVVPRLLEAGVEVVLLSDDALVDRLRQRFGRPGLIFEGLRLEQAKRYFREEAYRLQWWLDFFRRAGASNRINLEAVESYIRQVEYEAHARRKRLMPFAKAVVGVLRRSRAARQALGRLQRRFTPHLYNDLFARYRPDLVIAATPGWRYDRYLLRDAAAQGIPTAAVIVGWDNSSSYSLPGAPVEHITCWSEIQKEELVLGSDWPPERVHIGGIPSYDGYFLRQWVMPRGEYFRLHGLDPDRKLIAYACSFVTFSPNIQNIEALARLVAEDRLDFPAQLLVRLHPNHFMDRVPRFAREREQILSLAREYPHVHVVEPVPLGGSLGYYSGEDMPEKSSMMVHADVFTTVYSTMVVETAIHDTPVVSVCIDHPEGWPGHFSLRLSEIGGWPTHSRFRASGAGKVVYDEAGLQAALNEYLHHPQAEAEARRAFIRRECTYTDGSAGRRTADFFLCLLR